MSDADGTVDATAPKDLAGMHDAEVTAAIQRADVVGAFYAQLRQWEDIGEDEAVTLTVWEFHGSEFPDG